MRTSVIEVESPLIESQLEELDKVLERAISELNWTSDGQCTHFEVLAWGNPTNYCYYIISGAWGYIEPTRDQVCDLERRVRLAKVNVETMHKIMEEWSHTPLYQRKDKSSSLLNFEVLLNMVREQWFGLFYFGYNSEL